MEEYLKFLPLAFFPFWILITGIISLTGGWNYLSKKYPLSTNFIPVGALYRFQSIRIGKTTNYNLSINITVSDEGLAFRPIIIFSFLHKPIYLRYSQFRNIKINKLLYYEKLAFSIDGKNMQIFGKSTEDIKTKLTHLKLIK